MIDRLRELLRADGVTAWDAWAEASWEAEPDGMWSLAPFVRWAERELIIACSPDTIRELLDAHDRMVGALRRLVDAVDDYAPRDAHDWRCEYRTAEAGWVPGAPPVIRCVCGYDELAEAMGAALPLIGAAPSRAALAVPKEENPDV